MRVLIVDMGLILERMLCTGWKNEFEHKKMRKQSMRHDFGLEHCVISITVRNELNETHKYWLLLKLKSSKNLVVFGIKDLNQQVLLFCYVIHKITAYFKIVLFENQ